MLFLQSLVFISQPRGCRRPLFFLTVIQVLENSFPKFWICFQVSAEISCQEWRPLFYIGRFWNLFRGVLALCSLFLCGILLKSARGVLRLWETKCYSVLKTWLALFFHCIWNVFWYVICSKFSLLWRCCFVEIFCLYELFMKLGVDTQQMKLAKNLGTVAPTYNSKNACRQWISARGIVHVHISPYLRHFLLPIACCVFRARMWSSLMTGKVDASPKSWCSFESVVQSSTILRWQLIWCAHGTGDPLNQVSTCWSYVQFANVLASHVRGLCLCEFAQVWPHASARHFLIGHSDSGGHRKASQSYIACDLPTMFGHLFVETKFKFLQLFPFEQDVATAMRRVLATTIILSRAQGSAKVYGMFCDNLCQTWSVECLSSDH